MLALHALFVLVTKHNLEYPKFYDRLYNLINEDSFYANGRRTFFELTDVFLKSPALPGYCARVCKKFGRLSLSAPPAGAMLCVSFIHNLMRRHPKSCLPLIHRDRDVLGGSGGGGINIDARTRIMTTATERNDAKEKINEHRKSSFDEDPYDFFTEDPAKSRALESSLWEMTALENHYFPQVTKLVQMLRMDLGDSENERNRYFGWRRRTLVVFGELFFPLERRVGRSIEVGGVEIRHDWGSRFISLR